MLRLCTLCWILVASAQTIALELVVDPNGGSFHTIQQAIEAAEYGTIVRVKAGVYPGNITLSNGIQLVGENPNSTIIDASKVRWVVKLQGQASLSGFTLRRSGTSASLNNAGVVIEDCTACVVANNHIVDNHIGIVATTSSVTIVSNRLVNNHNAAIELYHDVTFDVSKNIIANHSDNSALSLGEKNIKGAFYNNTVVKNRIGVAYGHRFQAPLSIQLFNNLFVDNQSAIHAPASFAAFTSHNLFFNNTRDHWDWENSTLVPLAVNNLKHDPMFSKNQPEEYVLAKMSRAIGLGQNGVDIGAVQTQTHAAAFEAFSETVPFDKTQATQVDLVALRKSRVQNCVDDAVRNLKKRNAKAQSHRQAKWIDAFKALSDFTRAQAPGALPSALVTRLLQEEKAPSGAQGLLKQCAMHLGDALVKPLMENYAHFTHKLPILRMFSHLGSPEAVSLVRQELHSPDMTVRLRAMRLLFVLGGDHAAVDFHHILENLKLDPGLMASALNYLRCVNKAEWRTALFRLIRQASLPPEYLLRLLGFRNTAIWNRLRYKKDPALPNSDCLSLEEEQSFQLAPFPEHLLSPLIPQLIEQTQHDDPLRRFYAALLLTGFNRKPHLLKLSPLLDALLQVRFDYGATRSWNQTSRRKKSISKGVWRTDYAEPLLTRIENTLTENDIHRWLQQPRRLLEKLYLRRLLAEKKQQPLGQLLDNINIVIDIVNDQSGDTLASVQAQVALDGENRVLTLTPDTAFQYFEGHFTFDAQTMRIMLHGSAVNIPDSQHINRPDSDEEPFVNGFSFPNEWLTLGGSWTMRFQVDDATFTWRIRHVDN